MHAARNEVDRRLIARDAVTRVQAMWRGSKARDHVALESVSCRNYVSIALLVLCAQRLVISRYSAMCTMTQARQRGALHMQRIVRGFFGRKKFDEMEEHRTRFEYVQGYTPGDAGA